MTTYNQPRGDKHMKTLEEQRLFKSGETAGHKSVRCVTITKDISKMSTEDIYNAAFYAETACPPDRARDKFGETKRAWQMGFQYGAWEAVKSLNN
jgi:hypothetical protein